MNEEVLAAPVPAADAVSSPRSAARSASAALGASRGARRSLSAARGAELCQGLSCSSHSLSHILPGLGAAALQGCPVRWRCTECCGPWRNQGGLAFGRWRFSDCMGNSKTICRLTNDGGSWLPLLEQTQALAKSKGDFLSSKLLLKGQCGWASALAALRYSCSAPVER